MNLTGTEKAVRVLKELVSVWDRVKWALYSIRSITGSGLAQVKQTPEGIVIHVPVPEPEDLKNGRGLVGKWVKLVDYDDDGGGVSRNNYSGDVYRKFGNGTAVLTGIAVINSWERENAAALMAGYDIVTAFAQCGDIIGIEVLPLNQWYQIVDVFSESGVRKAIISQRNDPTFQES